MIVDDLFVSRKCGKIVYVIVPALITIIILKIWRTIAKSHLLGNRECMILVYVVQYKVREIACDFRKVIVVVV